MLAVEPKAEDPSKEAYTFIPNVRVEDDEQIIYGGASAKEEKGAWAVEHGELVAKKIPKFTTIFIHCYKARSRCDTLDLAKGCCETPKF